MAQDQARNEDFRLLRSGLPERAARAREARLRRDFCLTREDVMGLVRAEWP